MSTEEALATLATMTDDDFPTVTNKESGISQTTVDHLIATVHRLAGRPSLTAPGAHSPQITVRLPEETNRQVMALAESTGRRRSEIMREALDQYLSAAA